MEESSGFRFWDAIKAGFMGTIIVCTIMTLLGTDNLKAHGEMLVGADASPFKLYAAAAGLHLGIGILLGLLYALFLAPIAAFNALIKAIIFSLLLAVAAYYGNPKLPEMIAKVKGETVSAVVLLEKESKPQDPCAGDAKTQMTKAWLNYFVFSLIVAVLYRRKKC